MPSPLPAARAALRLTGVVLAVTFMICMATGWLYWLRSGVTSWPGPKVADALPLDELPGHDSVPLLAYTTVFAAAAALLGLGARALRLDRLSVGLALAAGTGAWLLAIDAFSFLVVRQVPAAMALREAVGLQAVYVTAALAGAGGALLARGSRPSRATPATLGWLVAGSGLLDLLPALVPGSGHTLGSLAPFAASIVSRTAHLLLVPAGVLLLIASRGLIRRNRPAWRLAAGLLGVSVVLQLLHGPRYASAIVTGLVAVALIARRDDFRFSGDPAARPSAAMRLLGGIVFALGYGVAAALIHRAAFGRPEDFPGALTVTLQAMGSQVPHDVGLAPAEPGDWFSISVMSIVAVGAIWAAAVWIRPWRQRHLPDVHRRQQAAGIVRGWGADTLAPFTLRPDKEWFIAGQTLIAFRVIRGVALVSGDPVGPPGEAGQAMDGFLAHAQARGWRTAVLGASDRLLASYRERGLHPLYHGDEAVIDVNAFSLDGRPMRTVRQAVHRLQRGGFTSEIVPAGGADPELKAELSRVEHAWLRGGVRKGFAMELDGLFCLDGDDALFVIGRDEQGRVTGFLHFAVCRPSRSLSLSTMPRQREAPNGFTAWLVSETVTWARDHGFTYLSLNFSPFAGLLAAEGELRSVQRLQRRALLRLKGVLALQLDNLLRFNGQFRPAWRPRYVMFQSWADLPRVAVAAMAAEGYLPSAGLIRGRNWSAPGPPAAWATPAAEITRAGGAAAAAAGQTGSGPG